MDEKYWIAMDGGGTKTLSVLGDKNGKIVAFAAGPSTNIHSNSQVDVRNTLILLIEELIRKTNKYEHQIEQIQLCLAGCGRVDDANLVLSLLEDKNYSSKIKIKNDAEAALAAGTWGEPGVVLIAGTGSIAYSIDPLKNQTIRVGGWGNIIGDEGSGFYIGKEGLNSVLKQYDGRGSETLLTPNILKYFNIEEPPDIITKLNQSENKRTEIAKLARIVIEAAEHGDQVAIQIINDAIAHLKALIITIQSLNLFSGRIPVVLAGGLFLNSYFRNLFYKEMEAQSLNIQLIESSVPPVIGSYILSLKESGLHITKEHILNMRNSWVSFLK